MVMGAIVNVVHDYRRRQAEKLFEASTNIPIVFNLQRVSLMKRKNGIKIMADQIMVTHYFHDT